jgi:hypothetical protein
MPYRKPRGHSAVTIFPADHRAGRRLRPRYPLHATAYAYTPKTTAMRLASAAFREDLGGRRGFL